jgi:hypothetical protein
LGLDRILTELLQHLFILQSGEIRDRESRFSILNLNLFLEAGIGRCQVSSRDFWFFLDKIGLKWDMLQTHELLLQLVCDIIIIFRFALPHNCFHFFNNFILGKFATSFGAGGTFRGHCYFDMILAFRLASISIIDVISCRISILPFFNYRLYFVVNFNWVFLLTCHF